MFTGGSDGALRRSNFRTASTWGKAVAVLGAPELRFHDLRHTGNTWAAQTRTSLRDLMARMGHDSPRAALIYQHATSGADRAIADAMDAAVVAQTADDETGEVDDGTAGALVPVS